MRIVRILLIAVAMPRVAAAISIAGVGDVLGPRYGIEQASVRSNVRLCAQRVIWRPFSGKATAGAGGNSPILLSFVPPGVAMTQAAVDCKPGSVQGHVAVFP